MLESLLITIGPIVAALVVLAAFRLRRMMASKTNVVAEYQLPDEEDGTDVSDEEAERVQRLWRRSYSK